MPMSAGIVPTTRSTSTTTTEALLVYNCSGANCTRHDDVIWHPDVIQRVTTIVIFMVLTLIGNTTIILMLTCTRYRKRNSRVNIFIIHLAIGDLTVCFCTMTTEILFVAFGQWVLGAALCKLLTYLQVVTLGSTTFILTSMGFDRYLAICKPLKYRATTTRAKRFIMISWILAFVFATPQLVIFVQKEEIKDGRVYYECRSRGYTASWQRKLYVTFFTVYILIIPVALISFCYTSIVHVVSKASRVLQSNNDNNVLRRASTAVGKATFPRAKIKTLKMTLVIIAIFVVCWTPYFVTTLIAVYSNYTIPIPQAIMASAETMAFVQSFLNPIVYGCFNIKLKRGLSDLFCVYGENGLRRSPSNCYRSPGLLMSVSSAKRGQHMPVYEMQLGGNARIRENQTVNMVSNNSSSGNSQDRSLRTPNTLLKEENKNGIKLRVRFANRDQQCKYLPQRALNHAYSELNLPMDFLKVNYGAGAKIQVYKHHSLQELYT